MALNVDSLATQMLNATLPTLKQNASDAGSFAAAEFKKLAATMVSIESQLNSKQITQDQATLLLDMQKNASQSVLLAEEGMALEAAQNAINSALRAVAGVVNAAVHFSLL